MKRILTILTALLLAPLAALHAADAPKPAPAASGAAASDDPYRIDFKDVFDNAHYDQPHRPQVHYTPFTGQIADPTGLIWHKGTFHLFYMFDEWSRSRRDNKNWGHAVSNDCIHWEQLPHVTNSVVDNRPGSGSGIVDWNNSLGLESGTEKTLVIFYTDYGRGPSLAFSRDAGKTWIRHKANPILPGKPGRDPMVFWYKPDASWRMVIYEEPGFFAFYKSSNLTAWTFLSRNEGFFECPDLLHIPLDGNREDRRWVLIDGNGAYVLGDFDGTRFAPQGELRHLGDTSTFEHSGRTRLYTKDIYAPQTFKMSYEGDGPFIQLAFMKHGASHGRTWSQQLIFPVELTLRTVEGAVRLCRNPIDGIKQLRFDPSVKKEVWLRPGENPLSDVRGDVLEILAKIEPKTASEIQLSLRGEPIVVRPQQGEIEFMGQKARVARNTALWKLRVILDRSSVEVFVNDGEVSFTRMFFPNADQTKVGLSVASGEALLRELEAYKLRSIWLKRERELGYDRRDTNTDATPRQ